jgi:hypothetical protein
VDHETGFALLHLDGPDLHPSPLAATGRLAAGAPVFLLTCQDENERKGASGHVVVVGPFEAFWEYMLDRAIITNVVNPGLAGAPLFDALGHLVGVVSLVRNMASLWRRRHACSRRTDRRGSVR